MRHHDPLEAYKWSVEQTAIDGGTTPRWPTNMNTEIKLEATEELRERLCEALGWRYKECGMTDFGADRPEKCWHTPDMKWPANLPPLDANLIQQAREKLLDTDDLKRSYLDELHKSATYRDGKYIDAWAANWHITSATPEQQARAILAAIKP